MAWRGRHGAPTWSYHDETPCGGLPERSAWGSRAPSGPQTDYWGRPLSPPWRHGSARSALAPGGCNPPAWTAPSRSVPLGYERHYDVGTGGDPRTWGEPPRRRDNWDSSLLPLSRAGGFTSSAAPSAPPPFTRSDEGGRTWPQSSSGGSGGGDAPSASSKRVRDPAALRADNQPAAGAPRAALRAGLPGLAGALLSSDLPRILAYCDAHVPGLLPPRGSEAAAVVSTRVPVSLEVVQKTMHCLLVCDSQASHPEAARAAAREHLLSLISTTQLDGARPDDVALARAAMEGVPGLSLISWLQASHLGMVRRMTMRLLHREWEADDVPLGPPPTTLLTERTSALTRFAVTAAAKAVQAKWGLAADAGTDSEQVTASVSQAQHPVAARTIASLACGGVRHPFRSDWHHWEENYEKLVAVARVCTIDPTASFGISGREGRFPLGDVASAERLPATLASARHLSSAELEEYRAARARVKDWGAAAQRYIDGCGSRIFVNDLPTQLAAYSKPIAELAADISASGSRTWWFCVAEEWLRAGSSTSVDGQGDLIFVGISADFLRRQRDAGRRSGCLEPISPIPVPPAVASLARHDAVNAANRIAKHAWRESSGGENLCSSDDASLAFREGGGDAPTVHASSAPAYLNRLSSRLGKSVNMGTTWTFFPVPMTPEHAAVVRDLAAAMAGSLPLLAVETKFVNFSSHDAGHRQAIVRKVENQASVYSSLLRHELSQDPLLSPMNALQVFPFSATNTSMTNVDALDMRLSPFCPWDELWYRPFKFVFEDRYVDWALLRLRHCLSLGGWVAPLPREPPATIADIAPGTCGVLWDADGAPALLVSHADGGLGCAMAPIAFPAQTTHPKSDRAGLTHEDRSRYRAMLPLDVRTGLRQRLQLKLFLTLKKVEQLGESAQALVELSFPPGDARPPPSIVR